MPRSRSTPKLISCHAYRISEMKQASHRVRIHVQVQAVASDLVRNTVAWKEGPDQNQVLLTRLKFSYAHCEIMFNTRRHAGNKLEENNQVLIHPNGNLLVLIVLEHLPLIPAGLCLVFTER